MTSQEEARQAINLRTLQRIDKSIVSIDDWASYVVLYIYADGKWNKEGVEGTMFLYERSSAPHYGLLILNRNGMQNYVQTITGKMDIELQGQMINLDTEVEGGEASNANANPGIVGLWCSGGTDEAKRISDRISLLSDRANTANASSTSKTTTTTRYHQHAIHVPGTSANLGPGFDVAGIALSLSLDLTVSIPISEPSTRSLPRITYSGLDSANVPLSPYKNLLTRVALYVLRSNGISSFPSGVIIHAHNAIPFGRGLGSSGAAVIAGVLLGNLLGNLNLPKERLLDYALMVERHPDNVSAALMGGFIGSYLAELSPSEAQVSQIPLSEILPEYPEDAGEHWGEHPPAPPKGIGHFVKFGWAKEIKAVAVSPRFELATAKARGVLPESYSRKDVVFNLQRLAVLTTALARSPPDPGLIYEAMKDKMHQPYRMPLVPGLTEILEALTPQTQPGILGICLSGAGPTILALATENFDSIAHEIEKIFKQHGVEIDWQLLTIDERGSWVEDLGVVDL